MLQYETMRLQAEQQQAIQQQQQQGAAQAAQVGAAPTEAAPQSATVEPAAPEPAPAAAPAPTPAPAPAPAPPPAPAAPLIDLMSSDLLLDEAPKVEEKASAPEIGGFDLQMSESFPSTTTGPATETETTAQGCTDVRPESTECTALVIPGPLTGALNLADLYQSSRIPLSQFRYVPPDQNKHEALEALGPAGSVQAVHFGKPKIGTSSSAGNESLFQTGQGLKQLYPTTAPPKSDTSLKSMEEQLISGLSDSLKF